MNANVDVTELKQKAADYAVQFVASGMVVGLGHGTTAVLAVRRIAQRLRDGDLHDIIGVPCSTLVDATAAALGIRLTTLDEHPVVNLTIDGADEVAPNLDLIKGRGGALLREKMIAQATTREIIIVDESKLVPVLGSHVAVPVEVIPFGWRWQVGYLEGLGARVTPRAAGNRDLYRTDQYNLILDCDFGPIADPPALARQLESRAGIAGHGLFLGLASEVVVGTADGVRHMTREAAR